MTEKKSSIPNNTTIKKSVKIKEKTPKGKGSTVKKTFKKTPFFQKTASVIAENKKSTERNSSIQKPNEKAQCIAEKSILASNPSDPLKKLSQDQVVPNK